MSTSGEPVAKYDTSRARLLIAMQQFDVHHRGKLTDLGDFTEKNPWPDKRQSRLIHHDSRYYPPKKIVKLAMPNFDLNKEITQKAQRIVEIHGFEVINFGRKESPQTCCWDGFSDSRKFDRCLPFKGEEFWELLIQRAGGSDLGSVFDFNGNKRKIGGVENTPRGKKIVVQRSPNSGSTEWSDSPSKVLRNSVVNGFYEMLDSTGVCSEKIFASTSIHNQAIVYLSRDLLEWTDEGEISIISVGSDSRQRKHIQAPNYFAYWCPKFAERFSPENLEWVDEKDQDGESKMENLSNVMGHMLQRAWFKHYNPKLEPIEFKKQHGAEETLPSDCNSRLVAHNLHHATRSGSTYHFKRYVRITRASTETVNDEQFFINTYFPGYESGKSSNGEPRKTNVTINPKIEPSEIAFTAGIVIPKAAPNEEKSMLEKMTSAMEAAGFQQLFDCDPKERNKSTNSKRVFLLARQSTSVENWNKDISRGLNVMASIIAPIWSGENSDTSTPKTSIMSQEERIIDKIIRRKFVILEGVPGTGKTHIFKEMKGHFAVTRFLTFHPSSDYSSFIGGIRPGEKDDELIFNPTKGHLLKILEEADEEDKPVLLWIDELNRANVPRVFGDLISLIGNSDPPVLQIHNAGLEKGDRLELTSNQKKNLHIVATMNTSDRSVTPLDAALRRRFSFVRLQPKNTMEELTDVNPIFSKLDRHIGCFLKLNDILRKSMGEDAILGHSYLFEMLKDRNNVRNEPEIVMIWKYSILPNIVDTLMLTQSFGEIKNINIALVEANILLMLVPKGKGLGEIIVVEEVN